MPHPATGRALAACFALAVSSAGAQAMYKWVDEKGVTHFSEHPPPDGRKAAKVEPKVIPPSSPQPAARKGEAESWKAQETEFRKRQITRGQREQAEAKEQAQRQAACDQARSRLAFLQNSHRIYRDNPDGSRTYMNDAQRESELARQREAVRERCD